MSSQNGQFPYEIRVAPRSKRVKLAFNPYRGLEIVIPKRFPRREIPRILQQHEQWISEQFRRHADKLQGIQCPQYLELALTGENLPVHYLPADRPRSRRIANTLHIHAADDAQRIQELRHWLRGHANACLKPMLQEVSLQLNLSYAACTVRGQKSRWGSCSSRGRISLNEQLLFMPEATVRYLMIHELCHTRHMNHSAAFWRLVASFEPDYRRHEQALDRGRQAIPAWYLQDLYRNSE